MKENVPKQNHKNMLKKVGIVDKLRRGMVIFLASVGIFSSNAPAQAQINTEAKVEEINEKKNDFLQSIKVNLEDLEIDESSLEAFMQVADKKEFSKVNHKQDEVKEYIEKLYHMVDENYERNAIKRGIKITCKEFKMNLKKTLEELDDFILVDIKDKEDPYVKFFEEKENRAAFYSHSLNLIVVKEDSRINESLETVLHEVRHKKQARHPKKKCYLPNEKALWSALREGDSDNYAKNGEELRLEKSYNRKRASMYPIDDNIYNRTSYLLGQEEMSKCMENATSLYDDIILELQEKYGRDFALEYVSSLTKTSLACTNYSGKFTPQRENELREQMKEDIKELTKLKNNATSEEKTQKYDFLLQVNQEFENFLDKIDEELANGKSFSNVYKIVINQEMKKVEQQALDVIKQQVNQISSKEEALQQVKSWDYYRSEVLTRSGLFPKFEPDLEEAMCNKKAQRIQNNLFQKCQETGTLKGIQTRDEFDAILQARLYDISNAKIKYTDHKTIIYDNYIVNTFKYDEKKGEISDDFINLEKNTNIKELGNAKRIFSEGEKVFEK